MNLRLCLAFLLATSFARADVSLPKVFSSHMVLQREMPIHIWGFASPGEKVAVDFHGSSASATADDLGRWSVYLPAQPAGGPFTLTVRAANTVTLDDILLGDLWLAAGQSNMEMPLAGFPSAPLKDSEKEIAAANHPQIRLLLVDRDTSEYPLDDVKSAKGWSVCTPENARNFSAAAYFFARDIQEHQHVPIGLIDSTWGGTPAEAWVSLTGLSADPGLMPLFAARADRMTREAELQRLDAVAQQALAESRTPPKQGYHPNPLSYQPAALFNAMIAPFTPLPIRGVIWYQGETNARLSTVEIYNRVFSELIQDWRHQWRQGDFPFLFAQISGYQSTPEENWGLLRDAQRRALSLANTGMAVTIDVGNQTNVHPADKQTVGARLALLARSDVYGEKVTASGPLFRLAYPEGNTLHVWFDYAEGLTTHGAAPQGFEIAGADGRFVPATVRIEGNSIVATSPTIPEPRYVRYAWPNFPANNLSNGAGLPASTFTSYPEP
ncbi:sialate O-acetylesterase [Edaphobacter aggregans]|uniref:sialate O-acetylesterase n=1 Tax=Edaphobacter aggregans TaxID=570835 RepID=UPI00054DBD34|nr:sialate O-acetylesterase [Edaphobacter aggregans]